MKLFTIKQILSSCQLLDEAGNIVAERLANFVFSTNERLKIKDQIYRIKYSGFFGIKLNTLMKREMLL
ncbi:hypothetical protein [Chryseobacterium mucoviscidosis]|uniref:hypothetical protein n=1 Tax=Chryseobacterium mucoviscidosis TaxID=1945581 RepID=UPI0031D42034